MNPDRTLPHDWFPGKVPENVHVADSAYIQTTYSFQLFRSQQPKALDIGKAASIYLGVMFDLGPAASVKIGSFSLLNGARIICDAGITVGNHCLISWNVVLMDTYRYSFDAPSRRKQLEQVAPGAPVCDPQQPGIPSQPADHAPASLAAGVTPPRPIHIGNNVWIGFDTCILPGVRIGDGSVVGARSVVAEDVPPMTVVAGNPARVIRTLVWSAPAKRSDDGALDT